MVILLINLFHEIFGYEKGGYSTKTNDICNSPKVFYDKKEKKILKLVKRNCPYITDNEVPILRDEKKENVGDFLEYFIGKWEYGFYSEIIEIMTLDKINLNFILDVEMWNKKIDVMRKYIKFKYIVYSYNKNLLDKKKYSDIEVEIGELENIIKEKNIDLNNIKKINDIKNIGKNDDIPRRVYEKYKNCSSEELQNIAFNKSTPREIRDIIYEIIFSRILKN